MYKKIVILIGLFVFSMGSLASGIDLKIKDKNVEIYTEPEGAMAGVLFDNIVIERMDERGSWVQGKVTFWIPKAMVNRIFLEEKENLTWDTVHRSPLIFQDRKITWISYLDKTGKTKEGEIKWYLLARNRKTKELKARRDGLFFGYFDKRVGMKIKQYGAGDWVLITGKILGAGAKSGDEEFGYVIIEISKVERVIVD